MSWFQIGSGYYGLSTASVKLSQDDRDLTAKAFESAFSIPSKDIKVQPAPVKAEPQRTDRKEPRTREL